ncbi:Similarity with glutathionylspermidine synthase (EC 6.3.1.8), group 1 [Methylomonas albis]|uniref:Glutathionylspermidine synthase family protein n=1 Tax=Methylomonas albis TaxID=1854563 RepID=A0ABR9CX46_9GAMM|nr:glutathionylspermidine synthase family protein [Methylomonas albis]MBD9355467.1 glutathionylspermidine synthase family protein [Methylomonas albis]CAD6878453.1 Similarity with glutathionylspermidine synthase (EC 6.3.1.8), group 1 [Methylomonas albis]
MQRIEIRPRADWQQRVEAVGMIYHTLDGDVYWDESACYRFTANQIDILDDTTAELHALCLQAVQAIIDRKLFNKLLIPDWAVPYIVDSWERREPSVYGRFDLAWDGSGQPKLLEYNADTPTALLEAAVVQWFWLRDCYPNADQFNSIHEKLLVFWQHYRQRQPSLHFAGVDSSDEDSGNLEYMRDTAVQAGLQTHRLAIDQIGWDASRQRFVDLRNNPINALFKLYPWEWLLQEEFGPYLPQARPAMLEPPWKLLLSNKGLLPILWELFPSHPNLLEASFADKPLLGDYVRKPLYSREGANIQIRRGASLVETGGSYGGEACIYQRYTPLPNFAGNFPVIGSWVIADQPAGIGIREDKTEITGNNSRFIPHYFVEN